MNVTSEVLVEDMTVSDLETYRLKLGEAARTCDDQDELSRILNEIKRVETEVAWKRYETS